MLYRRRNLSPAKKKSRQTSCGMRLALFRLTSNQTCHKRDLQTAAIKSLKMIKKFCHDKVSKPGKLKIIVNLGSETAKSHNEPNKERRWLNWARLQWIKDEKLARLNLEMQHGSKTSKTRKT